MATVTGGNTGKKDMGNIKNKNGKLIQLKNLNSRFKMDKFIIRTKIRNSLARIIQFYRNKKLRLYGVDIDKTVVVERNVIIDRWNPFGVHIGKYTLLTAGVEILAHKVIVVDADLGGANLHTCLGVNITGPTLSDYITEEVLDLNQTIVQTGISDLKLISGAQDSLNVANITNVQKTRFVSALRTLDADYVILDLGAGTSYSVIEFSKDLNLL